MITGQELDKEVLGELRSLNRESRERVARHLVAAALYADDDPNLAMEHARFAARLGGRVGVVRETYGVAAYRNGDFHTAARELRTAQRITGRMDTLPMLADCERGLGRPQKALDIAASDDAAGLDAELTIELMIVVAGAYADTGDIETALRTLDMPALRHKVNGRWQVRLWVAYADLLERAGHSADAQNWLTLAADADTDFITDAAERLGRPIPQQKSVWDELESLDVTDTLADEDELDEAEDAEDGHDAEESEEGREADEHAEQDESEDDEPEYDSTETDECPCVDVDDPAEEDER